MTAVVLPDALAPALRTDVRSAGYTVETLSETVPPGVIQACRQGDPYPLRRAISSLPESPLRTMIKLWIAGDDVNASELATAFPHCRPELLARCGMLTPVAPGTFRAALSLTPFEPAGVGLPVDESRLDETLWFVHDLDDHLRAGVTPAHFVMGPGGATTTLLRLSIHDDLSGSRVLDLGTGMGIVAIIAARRGASVVATDISERALSFARFNALLNGVTIDGPRPGSITLLEGDLFEPLGSERFDLICANPPFVIDPGADPHQPVPEYRSSGDAGDTLMQRILAAVPAHLSPGGEAVLLGNWECYGTERFDARPRLWLERASGLRSAWVVGRETLGPLDYARTWARDSGLQPGHPGWDPQVAAWLDDFTRRNVSAIVMGWFRLLAGEGSDAPREPDALRIEFAAGPLAPVSAHSADAPLAVSVADDPPTAGHSTLTASLATSQASLASQFRTAHALAATIAPMPDAVLRSAFWTRADAFTETREYEPGAADPSRIWVTLSTPMFRSIAVDTATAAILGAADGDYSLDDLCRGLAELLSVDPEALVTALVPVMRDLVWQGAIANIEPGCAPGAAATAH